MSVVGLYGSRVPTKREREVIRLVAKGFKNKEIAVALGTSEDMVKNYLREIFDKLGFSNRVELALWYESRRGPANRARQHEPRSAIAVGTTIADRPPHRPGRALVSASGSSRR